MALRYENFRDGYGVLGKILETLAKNYQIQAAGNEHFRLSHPMLSLMHKMEAIKEKKDCVSLSGKK
jgi:hypothetical protein